MLKLIQIIKDFFADVAGIIRNIGNILGALGTLLVKCVTFMTTVFSHLPVVFTITVGVLVLVCVLYKIIGHEASS